MSRKEKRATLTPKKYGIEAIKEKTPAWTFAKSSESPSKSTAAITSYSINSKARNSRINIYSNKPGTAKATMTRFKDPAPGPGAYTIPSSVGVVAHYYRRNDSRSAARQFTTIS